MSDLERIVLTAIATIIGGVIVYFFGHLAVTLFVAPIHRLRSLIGEIADSLIFLRMCIVIPGLPLIPKAMKLR
jgi:membrane protein YqaA with SNARE-associated domain